MRVLSATFALLFAGIVGCADPPADPPSVDAAAVDVPVAVDVAVDTQVAVTDVVTVDAAVDVAADVATAEDRPAPFADARANADASPYAGPCSPTSPCSEGFQCYSEGCLPATPRGGRCEPRDIYHPCMFGLDCAPDAAGVHHCIPTGSEGSYCNRSTVAPYYNDCDEGLACYLEVSGVSGYYRCRPGLRVGEFCADTVGRCPAHESCCGRGSTCQSVDGTPRCVATPAAGTAGGVCIRIPTTPDGRSTMCPAGLECSSPFFTEPQSAFCVRAVPVGAACATADVRCVAGAQCVQGVDGYRCVPIGSIGASCRPSSPTCDTGLACEFPSGSGICRRAVPRGETCDATSRTTVCAEGDSCTTVEVTEPGRCVAPGTAPGADCRPSEPQCDGALRCSNFSRYRSTCRVVAAVGDACDLGGIRTLCPDATRCVPTTGSLLGGASTCVTSVTETEPNDTPAAPVAATGRSTLYRGALTATDRQDCYAVTVRDGASLYLETVATGLRVSLYASSGAELGRWVPSNDGGHGPLAGSARLRPETVGALRDLRAGTYAVCLGPYGAATPSYQLAIGVLGPRP